MAGDLILGTVEVTGAFDQISKDLQELLPHALGAAAQVFEEEISEGAPTSAESETGDVHPHIKDHVAFEVVTDSKGGTADIGFSDDVDHIALWLEYGHRMVGHAPGKDDLGFVQPHPFVRQAFDRGVDRALEAFLNALTSDHSGGT